MKIHNLEVPSNSYIKNLRPEIISYLLKTTKEEELDRLYKTDGDGIGVLYYVQPENNNGRGELYYSVENTSGGARKLEFIKVNDTTTQDNSISEINDLIAKIQKIIGETQDDDVLINLITKNKDDISSLNTVVGDKELLPDTTIIAKVVSLADKVGDVNDPEVTGTIIENIKVLLNRDNSSKISATSYRMTTNTQVEGLRPEADGNYYIDGVRIYQGDLVYDKHVKKTYSLGAGFEEIPVKLGPKIGQQYNILCGEDQNKVLLFDGLNYYLMPATTNILDVQVFNDMSLTHLFLRSGSIWFSIVQLPDIILDGGTIEYQSTISGAKDAVSLKNKVVGYINKNSQYKHLDTSITKVPTALNSYYVRSIATNNDTLIAYITTAQGSTKARLFNTKTGDNKDITTVNNTDTVQMVGGFVIIVPTSGDLLNLYDTSDNNKLTTVANYVSCNTSLEYKDSFVEKFFIVTKDLSADNTLIIKSVESSTNSVVDLFKLTNIDLTTVGNIKVHVTDLSSVLHIAVEAGNCLFTLSGARTTTDKKELPSFSFQTFRCYVTNLKRFICSANTVVTGNNWMAMSLTRETLIGSMF